MTTTINVNGMTCNGCVNSVTNAIKRVAGVENVQVSLDQKQAKVEYDENTASIAKIEAAIADAGYEPAGTVAA